MNRILKNKQNENKQESTVWLIGWNHHTFLFPLLHYASCLTPYHIINCLYSPAALDTPAHHLVILEMCVTNINTLKIYSKGMATFKKSLTFAKK